MMKHQSERDTTMRRTAAIAIVMALALAGCSTEPEDTETPPPAPTVAVPGTQASPQPVETLADDDPAVLDAEDGFDERRSYTSAPAGQDGSTITDDLAFGAGELVLPDAMTEREWKDELTGALRAARTFLDQRYTGSWEEPEHMSWIESAPVTDRFRAELTDWYSSSLSNSDMMVQTEATYHIQTMAQHQLSVGSTLRRGEMDLMIPYRTWEESTISEKPDAWDTSNYDLDQQSEGVVWDRVTLVKEGEDWLVDSDEYVGEHYIW